MKLLNQKKKWFNMRFLILKFTNDFKYLSVTIELSMETFFNVNSILTIL